MTVDIAALRKARQPPAIPPKPQRSVSVLPWVLVGVLAWILVSGRLPIPGPLPGPDIDIDGLHVLVVTPDDMQGLSRGQAEFAGSVRVAEWVDAAGGQYRRYPESQDISREAEVWRAIRKELDPPNRLGVLNDRRLRRSELPDGIDAGISQLERMR